MQQTALASVGYSAVLHGVFKKAHFIASAHKHAASLAQPTMLLDFVPRVLHFIFFVLRRVK